MTKRRQVKEALLNKGEDAARKLAADLHIGAKRLDRWFSQWLKGRAPAKVEAKEDGCPFGRGESVIYNNDDPKWVGVITVAGAEVSEVRWPSGVKQFVSNNVIRRAKRRTMERNNVKRKARKDHRENEPSRNDHHRRKELRG